MARNVTAFATKPSPIGGIHLADYARAITAQVTEMARRRLMTLVGHSFGGLVITLAAEAVLGQRRLVYLTTHVPVPSLPNGAVLASLPQGQSSLSGAILIGDPRVTGAQRINPRDPDPGLYGCAGAETALGWGRWIGHHHDRLPGSDLAWRAASARGEF